MYICGMISKTEKVPYAAPVTENEALLQASMICSSTDDSIGGGLEDYTFDPIV